MFTEPLPAFFTDFAQDATWSVGPATVQVIFDNAHAEIPFGEAGAAVSASAAGVFT